MNKWADQMLSVEDKREEYSRKLKIDYCTRGVSIKDGHLSVRRL